MKNKGIFLVLGVFLVLGLLVGGVVSNNYKEGLENMEESKDVERLYQGPVPEGYNEEYFRHTGITMRDNIE